MYEFVFWWLILCCIWLYNRTCFHENISRLSFQCVQLCSWMVVWSNGLCISLHLLRIMCHILTACMKQAYARIHITCTCISIFGLKHLSGEFTFAYIEQTKIEFYWNNSDILLFCTIWVDDTWIMLHQIHVIPVKVKREYGKSPFRCVLKIAKSDC